MPSPAEETLTVIRKKESNKKCANCDDINKFGHQNICEKYKTFVCSMCKSAHQSFSHRVKSVTMSNWTIEEVEMLRDENHGGNNSSREVWFATWNSEKMRKPKAGDSLDYYKSFIQAVYNDKLFYSSSSKSRQIEKCTSDSETEFSRNSLPSLQNEGTFTADKTTTSIQKQSHQAVDLLDFGSPEKKPTDSQEPCFPVNDPHHFDPFGTSSISQMSNPSTTTINNMPTNNNNQMQTTGMMPQQQQWMNCSSNVVGGFHQQPQHQQHWMNNSSNVVGGLHQQQQQWTNNSSNAFGQQQQQLGNSLYQPQINGMRGNTNSMMQPNSCNSISNAFGSAMQSSSMGQNFNTMGGQRSRMNPMGMNPPTNSRWTDGGGHNSSLAKGIGATPNYGNTSQRPIQGIPNYLPPSSFQPSSSSFQQSSTSFQQSSFSQQSSFNDPFAGL